MSGVLNCEYVTVIGTLPYHGRATCGVLWTAEVIRNVYTKLRSVGELHNATATRRNDVKGLKWFHIGEVECEP
nr:hypothetical protein CFP56_20251 [Quercus suber]